MELLAPAGARPALEAAIEAGADSVYVGLRDDTNARAFPGLNFAPAELAGAAHFAHARGRKLLVAINTFARPGGWRRWCDAVDAAAAAGVDALIRSVLEAGRPSNVYAELGSTWRFVMRDPDQAAHLLGKLLKHLGEDNILWGTDSIWYGSPQDQIQAFRTFQISEEFQQRFGYPAITAEMRAKVFGLNALKIYPVAEEVLRQHLGGDALAQARQNYRNAPDPAFRTYGPKTRREFMNFLAWGG